MATRTFTGATDGDWSKAGNWAEAAVPVNGDDVSIDNCSVSIDAGLDQSAVTLATLRIGGGMTGDIGTAAAYLQVSATICEIGVHDGFGRPSYSPRVKIDFGSNQTACTVFAASRSSTDDPLPPVRLLGTHASNVLSVRSGGVGTAVEAGEASTWATVNSGQAGARGADVLIGDGVTLTNLNAAGGECACRCAATAITVDGGNVRTEGTGAVATLTNEGGNVYPNSTGTITALNCNGGVTSFLESAAARTVTTPKIQAGAALAYDPAVATMTTPPAPQEPIVLQAAAV